MLATLNFPCVMDNRAPLTFDTVSAQPSTSQAFCLVSFRVVRSLSNGGKKLFVSDPGRKTSAKSCGHLRKLPHVVNLVQPANLREPRANRRDQTATGLDSSSPKWVDTITPRQSALDDIGGSHTMRSPILEEFPGSTCELVVRTQSH